MNTKKIPKPQFRTLQIFIISLIFLFGISFISVFAQSWKEPSTQNPSVITNAASVPDLIRVQTPTSTPAAEQNKQAVEGKLRIGSASSTDMFSSLEVYGDTVIQNSVLVDASIGGTKCATVDCTNGTQNPAFLVQEAAGSVGIGTNALGTGRLNVLTQSTDPYGAVYVTSTSGYGVWARATAANKSGIKTSASGQNSIAVFGKAIDVQHRGIYAVQGSGVAAAQFKGNVTVVGGIFQGDGSQLIRVGSISDTGLPQAGQIGMSTWVKRGVAVAANQTTTVSFNFPSGQGYIVKYVSVMLGNAVGTFTPLYGVTGITAQVSNSALEITNTTGTAYPNSVIYAQVQSGVAAAVYEYMSNPGQATEIASIKPILFVAGGNYELGASVAGASSQNFFWKIESGQGSLCPSAAACSNTELTSNVHVFYQMPGNYPSDKAVSISVTWQGSGGGAISKTTTLHLFDLSFPPSASDRSVEMSEAKEIPITVTSVYSPATPDLTFETTGCTGCLASITPATAVFTAPNSLSPVKYTLTAKLAMDPTVKKTFDVYVVPKMTIATTFPDGPQQGQATTTVATTKDLHVHVDLLGSPSPSTAACPSCTQSSWNGTDGTFHATLTGTKQITLVWTPNASMGYPAEFTSYTKSKTITVGQVICNATSTLGSTAYVSCWAIEYPSPFLESPIVNTSGNNSTFSDVTKSFVFGGNIGSHGMALTDIQNSTGVTRVTYSVTPGAPSATVHVYGRSRFDLRAVADITMTVPTTACVCLGGSSQPNCCNDAAIAPQLPNQPN